MERKAPVNCLNDLNAKEWIKLTSTVWIEDRAGLTKLVKKHPAPFSLDVATRLIRMFTKEGETVFDPMMGTGTTLVAASALRRHSIGIELHPYFYRLTKKRLRLENARGWKIIRGDAGSRAGGVQSPTEVTLIVTSPPYWNILTNRKQGQKTKQRAGLRTRYSDIPSDLGNIEQYPTFLNELEIVLGASLGILVRGGHVAIVVSDFVKREPQGVKYYRFVNDVAEMVELHLHLQQRGKIILYQSYKRAFPYGYPRAYVPNFHHQEILIFRKNTDRP